MTKNDSCSLTNLINIIRTKKQKGIKNHEIIKHLTKKGCCFQAIFNAMDKTTQKEVQHESI